MSRRSPLDRSDPELFGRLIAIEARLGSATAPLLAFVLLWLGAIAFGGGELRRLAAAGFPALLAPLGASVFLAAILFAPLRLLRARLVDSALEILPANPSGLDRILGLLCGDKRVGGIAAEIAVRLRDEPLPECAPVAAGAGSFRSRAPEWIGALWRTDKALHGAGLERGSWLTVLFVATWIPALLGSLLLYSKHSVPLREVALTVPAPFWCAGFLLLPPLWVRHRLAWLRRRESLLSGLTAAGIRTSEVAAELEALGQGAELCGRLGHPRRKRSGVRVRKRRTAPPVRGEPAPAPQRETNDR